MTRILLTIPALTASAMAQNWVNFADETTVRMRVAGNDPSITVNDTQEKDYAWGDVDLDGDIDLVCVRKQPFTSTGRDTNILFMNEGIAEGHAINGVLIDRTADYAVDSDVSGDQGFLTPTNDRDVVLADLNGDGWLDMATAPTLTDNSQKHLSHPRIYINLGESGGVWQGFRFEDARIPEMHPTAGPRFCSVAAGDVDGDGDLDLYFGDYDSGGSQIFDYNNRLLMNNGSGFFTDETNSRLTGEMSLSAFGAASAIADMNGDGVMDVVKQTSLNAPQHVAVTYNNPSNEGVFNRYDIVNQAAPYFVSVDDLNGDGRLDLVVVDDNVDTYLLNQGNDGQGQATFTSYNFQNSAGFGGNSWSDDLNNDGFPDVIITDVDVDIAGCDRRTLIYRNLGNTPNVSFQEQGFPIPQANLFGVHDMAVFDLNGDGWLDIVSGRCNGTEVWVNQPPVGVSFGYPGGVPQFLPAGSESTLSVQLTEIGGSVVDPSSVKMFVSIDGGSAVEQTLTSTGGLSFEGTLPAVDCPTPVSFYVQASLTSGAIYRDPPAAPAVEFDLLAAEGVETSYLNAMEQGDDGWTTASEAGTTAGFWELADPNGTLSGGVIANPEDDASAGAENVNCWMTQNGVAGGTAGSADLDGGPVTLYSSVLDLEGSDGTVSFARWFYCSDEGTVEEDFLRTFVSSDNGATFTEVTTLATTGTSSAWETVSFRVGDWVEPSAEVIVAFQSADAPNNSITEAGIDDFSVEEVVCGEDCPTDVNSDGLTDFGDILEVLSAWDGVDADVDGDGTTGFSDLVMLLSAFGPC